MSELEIIPAAKNWVRDPRPNALTYFAGTYTSRTLVTDRSYSGNSSVLYQLADTAGQEAIWYAFLDTNPEGALIPSAATLRGMVHVSGPLSAGWRAQLVAEYTDLTTTTVTVDPLTVDDTLFKRIIFPDLVLTAGKTVRRVWVTINRPGGGAGNAATFYLGGLDLRVNQPLDSFISGAGGQHYAWTGTVNDSPSTRAAYTISPVRGSGGQIYTEIILHVVTRQNLPLREITEHFIDGSVNYDLDAEQWKGSCTLTLDDPELIDPLADEYVRVTLRITEADGTVEEDYIGMFIMDPPKEQWSAGYDRWTYEGKDMLALLSTWMLRGPEIRPKFGESINSPSGEEAVAASGYVVFKGNTYQAAVDNLLFTIVGLDRSQVAIDLGSAKFTQDYGAENGTSVLTALTEILKGAGYQSPWVIPNRLVITTARAGISPADVAPSVVLATGENSPIRWPFDVDPEIGGVGNRVRAFTAREVTQKARGKSRMVGKRGHKKRKKGKVYTKYWNVPVEAVRINNDPAHPLSIQRLERIIDLPDVNVPLVKDTQAAIDIADQALRDASLIPIRARLTTRVMIRGLGEVYELDMNDAYGNPIPSGQGRYWCRGWTMQLGMPWQMTHNLTRVVGFEAASWS